MHCVDAGHCCRRREVAWSVCLCQPVGHDSRPRVLQKRLNRSKYRVGVDSGELYDGGPHLLREAAFYDFGEIMCWPIDLRQVHGDLVVYTDESVHIQRSLWCGYAVCHYHYWANVFCFFALYSTGYFSPCHAAVVRCNAMQYNISIYNARMVSLRAESEAWPVARGKDGEARVWEKAGGK